MILQLRVLILDFGRSTFGLLFGCPHQRTTWPRRRAFRRRDQAPDYMACLECGAQLDHRLFSDPCLSPPRLTQPRRASVPKVFA